MSEQPMSRRDFLKAGGVVAGALTLIGITGGAVAVGGDEMDNLKAQELLAVLNNPNQYAKIYSARLIEKYPDTKVSAWDHTNWDDPDVSQKDQDFMNGLRKTGQSAFFAVRLKAGKGITTAYTLPKDETATAGVSLNDTEFAGIDKTQLSDILSRIGAQGNSDDIEIILPQFDVEESGGKIKVIFPKGEKDLKIMLLDRGTDPRNMRGELEDTSIIGGVLSGDRDSMASHTKEYFGLALKRPSGQNALNAVEALRAQIEEAGKKSAGDQSILKEMFGGESIYRTILNVPIAQ